MASRYRQKQPSCYTVNARWILFFHLLSVGVSCFLGGCITTGHNKETHIHYLSQAEQQTASALAHYCQGLINEGLLGDNSPKTLKEYLQATELDPNNHMLHSITATTACRQNTPNSQLARKHFLKAIDLEPSDAILYVGMARICFYDKKDEDALAVLADGFKNAKSEGIILAAAYAFSSSFIAQNNMKRAIPCVEFLATRSQHSNRYYHLLGDLYSDIDKKESIRCYTMATKATKPLPESFITLAAAYAESNLDYKAEETLISGTKSLPDNTFILMGLARLYNIQEKIDKSLNVFAKIKNLIQNIQNKTITTDFYMEYGSTLDIAGRKEDAEKLFLECIKFHPNAHQALNYIAYMWAEQDTSLEIALEYANRAIALKPMDGAYLDTLGWIYYKQKKYKTALELTLQSATIIKDDPVISEHIGDIYKALNNDEKANHFWLLSHKADPSNTLIKKKLKTLKLESL